MREAKMYYYDYQESFVEMIARNLQKILTVVTVSFVFSVMLYTIYGNIEVERMEMERRIEENLSTIDQVIPYEPEITVKENAIKAQENAAASEDKELETIEEAVEIKDTEVIESVEEKSTEMLEITEEKTIPMSENMNYNLAQVGREDTYKVVYVEAGAEGPMGQTLVTNVILNNMREKGYSSLTEEIYAAGRYSCVKNGEIYKDGKVVELSDVPQSVKDAVDAAFEYDYSEQMLKECADNLGITDETYWKGGATYFYNPDLCSEYQNSIRANIKVKFEYGNHTFYHRWDK